MADGRASDVVPTTMPAVEQVQWEQQFADQIQADPAVPVTEKQKFITARRGQGPFREHAPIGGRTRGDIQASRDVGSLCEIRK